MGKTTFALHERAMWLRLPAHAILAHAIDRDGQEPDDRFPWACVGYRADEHDPWQAARDLNADDWDEDWGPEYETVRLGCNTPSVCTPVILTWVWADQPRPAPAQDVRAAVLGMTVGDLIKLIGVMGPTGPWGPQGATGPQGVMGPQGPAKGGER